MFLSVQRCTSVRVCMWHVHQNERIWEKTWLVGQQHCGRQTWHINIALEAPWMRDQISAGLNLSCLTAFIKPLMHETRFWMHLLYVITDCLQYYNNNTVQHCEKSSCFELYWPINVLHPNNPNKYSFLLFIIHATLKYIFYNIIQNYK